MTRLSEKDIADELTRLPDWDEVAGQIQRTYRFDSFKTAMRFVNEVADEAEKTQHHPDVMIRYNKVTLALTTHDSGGITDKDFAMAKRADEAAGPLL